MMNAEKSLRFKLHSRLRGLCPDLLHAEIVIEVEHGIMPLIRAEIDRQIDRQRAQTENRQEENK